MKKNIYHAMMVGFLSAIGVFLWNILVYKIEGTPDVFIFSSLTGFFVSAFGYLIVSNFFTELEAPIDEMAAAVIAGIIYAIFTSTQPFGVSIYNVLVIIFIVLVSAVISDIILVVKKSKSNLRRKRKCVSFL